MDPKASVLPTTPQHHCAQLVSNTAIKPSLTIKCLGVIFDTKLSFDEHVTNVCRLCYGHIRAIRHVRASLPDDLARTVACSIIGSRLDYCNSLLAGTSKSNLIKLQRVQNTFARVTLRQGKFDRITPILEELHWLPIEKRITFKLATLSHNIKSTGQPVYLREQLSDYQPVRTLRSSSKHLLTVMLLKLLVVLDILPLQSGTVCLIVFANLPT